MGFDGSDHAGFSSADLFSSPPPLAGSDVKYLLICSVGIAIALLGNIFSGHCRFGTRGNIDSLDAECPDCRRFEAVDAVGTGRLSLLAGRLWNQNGAGSAAYLASRCTFRSPVGGFIAAVRGASQCAFVGILRAFEVTCAAGQTAFAKTCWCCLD